MSYCPIRPRTLVAAAGLVSGILGAPGVALAQPISWAAAVNGTWFDASKWNPNTVPNASTATVTLGLSGAYTTTLQNNSATIGTLTVSNPSAFLSVFDNTTLTVTGATIANSGLIQVCDPTAPGNTSRILLSSPIAVSGSGTLRLAALGNGDNATGYLDYSAAPDILTNGSGHTIAGKGRIYGGLVNNGTVNADQSTGGLFLQDQPKSNNSLMQATAGGTLYLRTALTQGPAAVLQTTGANSSIVLQSGSVNGGSFTGGLITTSNGTNDGFDNIPISNGATVQISDNTTLTVSSNLSNNGSVLVSSPGAPGNSTRLLFNAPVTVSGNGLIRLTSLGNGDNATGYLDYSVAADTITNSSTHTIAGSGRIYPGLINAGTLNADQAGQAIYLLDQPKSNSGIMEATNGSALYLRTPLTETGSGHLQATGTGSTIILQSSAVTGGSMTTGLLQTSNGTNNSLDNFTIAAPSTLQINDNTTVTTVGLVNNGLVSLDTPGAPGNATRLRAAAAATALTGTGTVRLTAIGDFNDSAYIDYTASGNVLTQAATHTIAGVGRLYVNLVNNGLVAADTVGSNGQSVLQLLDQPKTNNNLMKASNGGQIYITSDTVTQASTATLEADAGSAIVLQSASIVSGKLTTVGTGQVSTINGTNNTIDGVTLTSGTQVLLNDNTTLLARTSLPNNGTITIDTLGAPGNATRLMCDSPAVTISGPGLIRMQGIGNFTDSAYIWQNSFGTPAVPGVFTQAAGHTIAGNGRIYNGIINNGSILADTGVSGREVLQFLDQPKTNNSLIKATGGGQIYVSSVGITQGAAGQIVVDPGSTAVLQSATIAGGTIASSGTGLYQTSNGTNNTLDGVTMASGTQIQLNDNTTLLVTPNGLVNNGQITVDTIGAPGNSTRILATAQSTISGAGTVRLQAIGFGSDSAYLWGQGDAAHPLTLGSGQNLTGTGRLYGNIVLQGQIQPDQPFGTPSAVGRFEALQGSLTLGPTATYSTQIASSSSNDTINGNDAVTVGGALNVSFLPSYTPAAHDIFTVVSGTSVAGTFSSTSLPAVGSYGPAHVVYTPNSVLVVMCYGNCDGSSAAPQLNVGDFTCFLQKFAAGDPYANCDASTQAPILNVGDFTCFLQKYAAGCP